VRFSDMSDADLLQRFWIFKEARTEYLKRFTKRLSAKPSG